MNRIALGAALALIAVSTTNAQRAVQWRVEDGGNGHWYRPTSNPATWIQASASAANANGHLATITSAAENQFLAGLNLPSNGGTIGYWIGGIRERAGAGSWNWITGERWSYSNFDPPEPNGCCGADVRFALFRSSTAGGWDDTSFENVQFAIIEWSADCNGDGIVDYGQCRDGTLPDYNGDNIPDCCQPGVSCVVGNYPVQWRVEDGGNGHWYSRLDAPLTTWSACRTDALANGADLASISSDAEYQAIRRLVTQQVLNSSPNGLWLGGFKPAGNSGVTGWSWVDGTPWAFSRWCSYAPNDGAANSILFYNTNPGCWDDYFGGETWDIGGAFMEWSADCNGDGIVDKGQILRGELADTNNNGVPDVCDPYSPNLIVNGGFELSLGEPQPDCTWTLHFSGGSFIPGWSVVAGSVDRQRLSASCPVETESWTSFEGEFTIDLDGNTNGGAIAQTVVTEPGVRYRLSFQLTGNCEPGFTGIKRMRVEVGSNSYLFEHVCSASSPQPWNGKSLEFTASAGTTRIVFRSLSQGGLNGAVIDASRLNRLDPEQPSCRNADLLADRNINGTDLGILLAQWGVANQYTISDINRDGVVDGIDLGLLLSFWGACPY